MHVHLRSKVVTGLAVGTSVLLNAWAAAAGPILSSNIGLAAKPNTGAVTGGVTWSGDLSTANQGSTTVTAQPTGAGTASYTNIVNGTPGSVTVAGATNGTMPG